MNFKMKADLWWQERRGFLKGLFRNPLFLALGVRFLQPDGQTVVLRLPWNKTQKLLASEIPMAILVGSSEMALQLHLRQFSVYSPVTCRVLGVELELANPVEQSIEIRLKSSWPEWEQLRLELARLEMVDREFTLPIWSADERTLGSCRIRTRLQAQRLLS